MELVKVYKEMDLEDIEKESWCCDWVWERIHAQGREEEAEQCIEDYVGGEPVSLTDLNDFIRFELDGLMDLEGGMKNEEEEE